MAAPRPPTLAAGRKPQTSKAEATGRPRTRQGREGECEGGRPAGDGMQVDSLAGRRLSSARHRRGQTERRVVLGRVLGRGQGRGQGSPPCSHSPAETSHKREHVVDPLPMSTACERGCELLLRSRVWKRCGEKEGVLAEAVFALSRRWEDERWGPTESHTEENFQDGHTRHSNCTQKRL